jgi:hypothetical protein
MTQTNQIWRTASKASNTGTNTNTPNVRFSAVTLWRLGLRVIVWSQNAMTMVKEHSNRLNMKLSFQNLKNVVFLFLFARLFGCNRCDGFLGWSARESFRNFINRRSDCYLRILTTMSDSELACGISRTGYDAWRRTRRASFSRNRRSPVTFQ